MLKINNIKFMEYGFRITFTIQILYYVDLFNIIHF